MSVVKSRELKHAYILLTDIVVVVENQILAYQSTLTHRSNRIEPFKKCGK
jgi:hypothetical protein